MARANEQTIIREWGQTEQGKLYEGCSVRYGNPKVLYLHASHLFS